MALVHMAQRLFLPGAKVSKNDQQLGNFKSDSGRFDSAGKVIVSKVRYWCIALDLSALPITLSDKLIPSGTDSDQVMQLQEIEQRIDQLARHMDFFDASLSVDLLYWLADDLLMKVDRMTMAHSVEARAPYLDPDLILKALALPRTYKLRGNMGKFILRKLLEKRFPGAIGKSLAWRKKHGFEAPVDSWLRKNLRECVEDRLSPAMLAKSGLLDVAFASKVKENFYSLSIDTPLRRKVWLLLCFQTWYELHETGFGFR